MAEFIKMKLRVFAIFNYRQLNNKFKTRVLKTHNRYLGQFFKYHFYNPKITIEYTRIIPENVMSKYAHEV